MSKRIAAIVFITIAGYAQTPAPPTLDETIARAVANSPDLRALEAAVDEARANAMLADAFRSEATVSTTPGYATGLPIAVLGQVPAIGTIEAHRLLYDRSARAEAITSASQVDAAIARLASARREVAQNTATLYASVTAGDAILAAAQRRVSAYETIVTRTEALRGEGRVRDIDVDRAKLQLATAQNALARTHSRLELDRARLAQAVGSSGGQPPPVVPDTGDPELTSLDVRIAALETAAHLQNARFQPTIAAQVQYSRLFDRYHRFYLNFRPDDLSAGATITLPVFTGGHRGATSARLTAQIEQLKAEREARRNAVAADEREAAAEVTQAIAETQLAADAKSIAVQNLRIAQDLAAEGRGEPNDVPLAEIAVADAEEQLANANARAMTARARLAIIHGAFFARLSRQDK